MNLHRTSRVPSPPAEHAEQKAKKEATKLQRTRRWRRNKNRWMPLQQIGNLAGVEEETVDNEFHVQQRSTSTKASTGPQCPPEQSTAVPVAVTTRRVESSAQAAATAEGTRISTHQTPAGDICNGRHACATDCEGQGRLEGTLELGACVKVETGTEQRTRHDKRSGSIVSPVRLEASPMVKSGKPELTDSSWASQLPMRKQKAKCADRVVAAGRAQEHGNGQIHVISSTLMDAQPLLAKEKAVATYVTASAHLHDSRGGTGKCTAESAPLERAQHSRPSCDAGTPEETNFQCECTRHATSSVWHMSAEQSQDDVSDACLLKMALAPSQQQDAAAKRCSQPHHGFKGTQEVSNHTTTVCGGDARSALADTPPRAGDCKELGSGFVQPKTNEGAKVVQPFSVELIDDMTSCKATARHRECSETDVGFLSALNPPRLPQDPVRDSAKPFLKPLSPGISPKKPAHGDAKPSLNSGPIGAADSSACVLATAATGAQHLTSKEEVAVVQCYPGSAPAPGTNLSLTSSAAHATAWGASADKTAIVPKDTTTAEVGMVAVEEGSSLSDASAQSLSESRRTNELHSLLLHVGGRQQKASKAASCVKEDLREPGGKSTSTVQKGASGEHNKEECHLKPFYSTYSQMLSTDQAAARTPAASSDSLESKGVDRITEKPRAQACEQEAKRQQKNGRIGKKEFLISVHANTKTSTGELRSGARRGDSAVPLLVESTPPDRELQQSDTEGRRRYTGSSRQISSSKENFIAGGTESTESAKHGKTSTTSLSLYVSSVLSMSQKPLHTSKAPTESFSSLERCRSSSPVATARAQSPDRYDSSTVSPAPVTEATQDAISSMCPFRSAIAASEASQNGSCRSHVSLSLAAPAAVSAAQHRLGRPESFPPSEALPASDTISKDRGPPSCETDTNMLLSTCITTLRSTTVADNFADAPAACNAVSCSRDAAVFQFSAVHANGLPAESCCKEERRVSQSPGEGTTALSGSQKPQTPCAGGYSTQESGVHVRSARPAATKQHLRARFNGPAAPLCRLENLHCSSSSDIGPTPLEVGPRKKHLHSSTHAPTLSTFPQKNLFLIDTDSVRKKAEVPRCALVRGTSPRCESRSRECSGKSEKKNNTYIRLSCRDTQAETVTDRSNVRKDSGSGVLGEQVLPGVEEGGAPQATLISRRTRKSINRVENKPTLQKCGKPGGPLSRRAHDKSVHLQLKPVSSHLNTPAGLFQKWQGIRRSRKGHSTCNEEEWTSYSTSECSSDSITRKGMYQRRKSYKGEYDNTADGNSEEESQSCTNHDALTRQSAHQRPAHHDSTNDAKASIGHKACRTDDSISPQCRRNKKVLGVTSRHERPQAGVTVDDRFDRRGKTLAQTLFHAAVNAGAKPGDSPPPARAAKRFENIGGSLIKAKNVRDQRYKENRAASNWPAESNDRLREDKARERQGEKLQHHTNRENAQVSGKTPVPSVHNRRQEKTLCIDGDNGSIARHRQEKVTQSQQPDLETREEANGQRQEERSNEEAKKQEERTCGSTVEGDLLGVMSSSDSNEIDLTSLPTIDEGLNRLNGESAAAAEKAITKGGIKNLSTAKKDCTELGRPRLRGPKADKDRGRASAVNTAIQASTEDNKLYTLPEALDIHRPSGVSHMCEEQTKAEDVKYDITETTLPFSPQKISEELSDRSFSEKASTLLPRPVSREKTDFRNRSCAHLETSSAPKELPGKPRSGEPYDSSAKAQNDSPTTTVAKTPEIGKEIDQGGSEHSSHGNSTYTSESRSGKGPQSDCAFDENAKHRDRAVEPSNGRGEVSPRRLAPPDISESPAARINHTVKVETEEQKAFKGTLSPLQNDDKERLYKVAGKSSPPELVQETTLIISSHRMQDIPKHHSPPDQQMKPKSPLSSICDNSHVSEEPWVVTSAETLYPLPVSAFIREQVSAAAAAESVETAESDGAAAAESKQAATVAPAPELPDSLPLYWAPISTAFTFIRDSQKSAGRTLHGENPATKTNAAVETGKPLLTNGTAENSSCGPDEDAHQDSTKYFSLNTGSTLARVASSLSSAQGSIDRSQGLCETGALSLTGDPCPEEIPIVQKQRRQFFRKRGRIRAHRHQNSFRTNLALLFKGRRSPVVNVCGGVGPTESPTEREALCEHLTVTSRCSPSAHVNGAQKGSRFSVMTEPVQLKGSSCLDGRLKKIGDLQLHVTKVGGTSDGSEGRTVDETCAPNVISAGRDDVTVNVNGGERSCSVTSGTAYKGKEAPTPGTALIKNVAACSLSGDCMNTVVDTLTSSELSSPPVGGKQLPPGCHVARKRSKNSGTTVNAGLNSSPLRACAKEKADGVMCVRENNFSKTLASSKGRATHLAGGANFRYKKAAQALDVKAVEGLDGTTRGDDPTQRDAQCSQLPSLEPAKRRVDTQAKTSAPNMKSLKSAQQHDLTAYDKTKALLSGSTVPHQAMHWHPRARGEHRVEKINWEDAQEGSAAAGAADTDSNGELLVVCRKGPASMASSDAMKTSIVENRALVGDAQHDGGLTCSQASTVGPTRLMQRLLSAMALKKMRRKTAATASITEEEKNSCDIEEDVEWDEATGEIDSGGVTSAGPRKPQQRRQRRHTVFCRLPQKAHHHGRNPPAEGRGFSRSVRSVSPSAFITAQSSADKKGDLRGGAADSHAACSSCGPRSSARIRSQTSAVPSLFACLEHRVTADDCATVVPYPSSVDTSSSCRTTPQVGYGKDFSLRSAAKDMPSRLLVTGPITAASWLSAKDLPLPDTICSDNRSSYPLTHAGAHISSGVFGPASSPELPLTDSTRIKALTQKTARAEEPPDIHRISVDGQERAEGGAKLSREESTTALPPRTQLSADSRDVESILSNGQIARSQLTRDTEPFSRRQNGCLASLDKCHDIIDTAGLAGRTAAEASGGVLRRRDHTPERKVPGLRQTHKASCRTAADAIATEWEAARQREVHKRSTKFSVSAAAQQAISMAHGEEGKLAQCHQEFLCVATKDDANARKYGQVVDGPNSNWHEGKGSRSLWGHSNKHDRKKDKNVKPPQVEAGSSSTAELHRHRKAGAGESSEAGRKRLSVQKWGSAVPLRDVRRWKCEKNPSWAAESANITSCKREKISRQDIRSPVVRRSAENETTNNFRKAGSLRVFEHLLKGSRLKIEWDDQSSVPDSNNLLPDQGDTQKAAVESRDPERKRLSRGDERNLTRTRKENVYPPGSKETDTKVKSRQGRQSKISPAARTEEINELLRHEKHTTKKNFSAAGTFVTKRAGVLEGPAYTSGKETRPSYLKSNSAYTSSGKSCRKSGSDENQETILRVRKNAVDSKRPSETELGGVSDASETNGGTAQLADKSEEANHVSRRRNIHRHGRQGESEEVQSSDSITGDIAQLRRLPEKKSKQSDRCREFDGIKGYRDFMHLGQAGARGTHRGNHLVENIRRDEQTKDEWQYENTIVRRGCECLGTLKAKGRDTEMHGYRDEASKNWLEEGSYATSKNCTADQMSCVEAPGYVVDVDTLRKRSAIDDEILFCQDEGYFLTEEQRMTSARRKHGISGKSVESPTLCDDWETASRHHSYSTKEQYSTKWSKRNAMNTAERQARGRERRGERVPEPVDLTSNSSGSTYTAEARKRNTDQRVSPTDRVSRYREQHHKAAEQPTEFPYSKREKALEETQETRRSQCGGRRREQRVLSLVDRKKKPHDAHAEGGTPASRCVSVRKSDVRRFGGVPQQDYFAEENQGNVRQAPVAVNYKGTKQLHAGGHTLVGLKSSKFAEDHYKSIGAALTESVERHKKGPRTRLSGHPWNIGEDEEDNDVQASLAHEKYGKRDPHAAVSLDSSVTVMNDESAGDPEEAELAVEAVSSLEDSQELLTSASSNCSYAVGKKSCEEKSRAQDGKEGERHTRDWKQYREEACSFAEPARDTYRQSASDLTSSWTRINQCSPTKSRRNSPPFQRNAQKVVRPESTTRREVGDTAERNFLSACSFMDPQSETEPFPANRGIELKRRTARSELVNPSECAPADSSEEVQVPGNNQQDKSLREYQECIGKHGVVNAPIDTKWRRNCEESENVPTVVQAEFRRTSFRQNAKGRMVQQDVHTMGSSGGDLLGETNQREKEPGAQVESSNDRKLVQEKSNEIIMSQSATGLLPFLRRSKVLGTESCGRTTWNASDGDARSSVEEPTPAPSTVSVAAATEREYEPLPVQRLQNVRRHTRAPSTAYASPPAQDTDTLSRRRSSEKRKADGEQGKDGETNLGANVISQERRQATDGPGEIQRRSSAVSGVSYTNAVAEEKSLSRDGSTGSSLELLDGGEHQEHASWFRSVESLRTFPLLSSYDFVGDKGTAEIFRGSLPGPNSASLSSSNWHDRLQCSARQVFAAAKARNGQQDTCGDKELLLCKEIGHFTAAARTAAVALAVLYPRGGPSVIGSGATAPSPLYLQRDTFPVGGNGGVCPSITSNRRRLRVPKTANAFVEVTPESFPTVWQIYKPKFDEDSLFLFDSLVLTVIRGSRRLKVSAHEAGKIYSNDFKGRQAACTAIYIMHQTADIAPRTEVRHIDIKAIQVFDSAKIEGNTAFARMDLALPFAVLVEYRGQRILVEPLMPTNPPPVNVLEELTSSLREAFPFYVKQCSESLGSALVALSQVEKVDRHVSDIFKFLAKVLRLVDYPFPFGLSDFCERLALPGVQIWRSCVDQLCVVRNLQELLPPFVAKGRVQPTRRFREAFVRHVSDTSLPCTSRQPCDAIFEKRPELRRRSRALNAHELLESANETLLHQTATDLLEGVEAMTVNFLDSADISITMHEQGINTGLLGLLYSKKPGAVFQDALLREMLARASKRIFIRRLEKLHREAAADESWDRLTERAVVALFNLVFDKTEDSRMFWAEQLLPEMAEIFDVDIPINVSPSVVSVESLFKAMEYHIGVRFCEDVFEVVANSSGKSIRTGRLRIPLSTAHLSSFVQSRDALLFPHLLFIRRALQEESVGADLQTNEALGAEGKELEVAADSYGGSGATVAEDLAVSKSYKNIRKGRTESDASSSRYLRGFYPRIKVIVPDLAVLETAREQTKTFMRMAVFPLEASQSHTWAGLVSGRLLPMAFGTANVISSGLGGAIRANILGLGYPCHPHCMRKSELSSACYAVERSYATLLQGDDPQGHLAVFGPPSSQYLGGERDTEEAQSPIEACLTFQGCRVALLVLLTVYCMIGHDVVVVAKILQQLAYVLLQHGHHLSAATIAKYISTRFPDAVYLESEARLTAFQYVLKSKTFNRISAAHELLLPLFRSLEGDPSLRATMADLLVTAAAFQYEQWSAVVYHGTTVRKSAPQSFCSRGCRWATIAAMRLVGKSLATLGRSLEGIDILKGVVREEECDETLPPYVTYISRYWLGVALLKLNRFQEAELQVAEALGGLELVLGPHHPITLSTLFLLARIQQAYGCEEVVAPPIKPIMESLEAGDSSDANGHTDWRALTVEDLAVIEDVYGDQRRARGRKDALEAYGKLFRRLLVTGKYAYIYEQQPLIRHGRLQQQQLFLTVQETLKTKMCHLTTRTLRMLARRLQLLCVCQSGSKCLQRLALMQCSLLPYCSHLRASPSRTLVNEETTLTAASRECKALRTTGSPNAREIVCGPAADAKTPCDGETGGSERMITHFPFHKTTASYGSYRPRSPDVLEATVVPRPDNLPERQHSIAMVKLLLIRRSPDLILGLLRGCCTACKDREDLSPADWFDRVVINLLEERGALAELQDFVVMAANFFSPMQKIIFLHFLYGVETPEDVLLAEGDNCQAVENGSCFHGQPSRYKLTYTLR